MLIALEGLDRLGKSTVAHIVSRSFDPQLNIVKPCGSIDGGLIRLKDEVADYGFRMNDFFEDLISIEVIYQAKAANVLFDRTIVSADVYRRRPYPQDCWNFWLGRFLALLGFYVWIDADYAFYLERLKEMGEVNSERRMDRDLYDQRRGEFARYFENISKHTDRTLYVHNSEDRRIGELATEIVDFVIEKANYVLHN